MAGLDFTKRTLHVQSPSQDQSAPPPPPTDFELNKTRPPDAALPPSGGGHAQAQSPSMPLISSAPSDPGPAGGSSTGSGGVDTTDQGTARNTYSMQVQVLDTHYACVQ